MAERASADVEARIVHTPFVGVTTDGIVRQGLRSLDVTVKVDTTPIADAALVRSPNGGDYGRDLLAKHHQRFDHTGGKHVARS